MWKYYYSCHTDFFSVWQEEEAGKELKLVFMRYTFTWMAIA